MPVIACPRCGEDEELRGEPQSKTARALTCLACGHEWVRDTDRQCGVCGSLDLEPVATQVIESAGRGDQRTPTGIRDAYRCWSCGAHDVTSSHPRRAPDGWRQDSADEARRLRRRE